MPALPTVFALDLSPGGILSALSPYAIYIVIILAVLVLFGAIRASVVEVGESWGIVGVLGILFLLGLFLIATGWGIYGYALAGLSVFFLVLSGLSSRRRREHGERG
jgi:hypothetical protein